LNPLSSLDVFCPLLIRLQVPLRDIFVLINSAEKDVGVLHISLGVGLGAQIQRVSLRRVTIALHCIAANQILVARSWPGTCSSWRCWRLFDADRVILGRHQL